MWEYITGLAKEGAKWLQREHKNISQRSDKGFFFNVDRQSISKTVNTGIFQRRTWQLLKLGTIKAKE